jgi:hypothetical protein
MSHLIDKHTKQIILNNSDIRVYEEDVTQCVLLHPTTTPHCQLFCISGISTIQNGTIIEQQDVSSLLNTLQQHDMYCTNYVLVPGESFLRTDCTPTKVASDETDDGYQLLNSTRIESGHKLLTQDVTVVECAGELRFKIMDDGLVQIVSINLQTSAFGYPDTFILANLHRLGLPSENLYRTNLWENRGRCEHLKNSGN